MSNIERQWDRSVERLQEKGRLEKIRIYLETKIETDGAALRRKKQADRIIKIVKKMENRGTITSYKLSVLKGFYFQVNKQAKIISPNFILANYKCINAGSNERFIFLEKQGHNKEAVLQIVETHPVVLGYAVKRTEGIYDFLSSKGHSEEAVLQIVETLPSILGCTIKRTEGVYKALAEKGINSKKYIENFPVLLYFSPKFIIENSLEKIIKILFSIEEKIHKKRCQTKMKMSYPIVN